MTMQIFASAFTEGPPILDPTHGMSPNPTSGAAAKEWAAGLFAQLRPFTSGYAYRNYADASLGKKEEATGDGDLKSDDDAALRAYYGASLPRLKAAKAMYDPTRRFSSFAQSL